MFVNVDIKVEVDSSKLRTYFTLYGSNVTEAKQKIEDFFKKEFAANRQEFFIRGSSYKREYFNNQYALNTALAQGFTEQQWSHSSESSSNRDNHHGPEAPGVHADVTDTPAAIPVRRILHVVGPKASSVRADVTDTPAEPQQSLLQWQRYTRPTESSVKSPIKVDIGCVTDSPLANTSQQQPQITRSINNVDSVSARSGSLWWGAEFCKPVGNLALSFQFPFVLNNDQDKDNTDLSDEDEMPAKKLRKSESSTLTTKISEAKTKTAILETQIVDLVNTMKVAAESSGVGNILKTTIISDHKTPETVRLRNIPPREYELVLEVDGMRLSNFLDICKVAIDGINEIRGHWNVNVAEADKIVLQTRNPQQKNATHGLSKKRLTL